MDLMGDRGRAVYLGVDSREGTNRNYLEGPGHIEKEFPLGDFIVSALPRSLTNSGGGLVEPNPSIPSVKGVGRPRGAT